MYTKNFHIAFRKLHCSTSHLSLFKPPAGDLRAFVLSQDLIYVGGGNTFNMLVLWRAWKLDRILREAWHRGIVLAGISAGSLCWFEEGVTDSFGPLDAMTCLGFLPGSNCSHYDSEKKRRPTYQRLVRTGRLGQGYAADDGVGLHYVGRRLAKVVSSRPHAKAYRLEKVGGKAKETPLIPNFLGEA